MPKRVDANQAELVQTLRACGLHIVHLHTLGKGVPDLLVSGYRRQSERVEALLVEVKTATGKMTDDAAEAEEALEDLLYRHSDLYIDDSWTTWDVGEWLQAGLSEITAETTDEELKALAKDLHRTARSECVRLVGDVLDYITEDRDEKAAEKADA